MRRLAPSFVLALAVTTWACSGYVADTSVAPGDTVRVTAPSMDMDDSVGTVAALETDTLTVQVEDRADALYVPLADVTKLEVRRGQRSRVGKGALIGSVIGAVIGGVLGGLTIGFCQENESSSDPNCLALIPIGVGLVGAVGAVVGAFTGAVAGPGDRWETVPLDRIRVSLVSDRRGGLTVSASLFF